VDFGSGARHDRWIRSIRGRWRATVILTDKREGCDNQQTPLPIDARKVLDGFSLAVARCAEVEKRAE
jgi:hypothetical protein